MWIALSIVLFLLLLYLWCLKGRWGKRRMTPFFGWNYAHRGLHDREKPENSMAAFRAALEAGCGIELDIHLLKDGNLAVIHDSSLERTNYHLEGTQETIPQLQQVLDLFAGKAPLIVELKCYKHNVAPLCQAACKMMDTYEGL